MSEFFKITKKSPRSKARTGVLNLSRGQILTPAFMVVGTNGSVRGIDNQTLERLNAQILLANTYHLWLRPEMEVILNSKDLVSNEKASLHAFMGWKKPIITDSGGFQAFSLNKYRKFTDEGVFFRTLKEGKLKFLSPEMSMMVQTALKSDIALVLDECLEAEVDYSKAKNAMIRTYEWAKRSKTAFELLKKKSLAAKDFQTVENYQLKFSETKIHLEKKARKNFKYKRDLLDFVENNLMIPKFFSESSSNPENKTQTFERFLFGIPQGAQFLDLRKQSAKMTMELDFPGYSIGGVANGGEAEEMMYNQVQIQTEILEENKPKHLLGVGTPKDIVQMVARGIDLFDCVYPTRNARHGSLFYWLDEYRYCCVHIQSLKFKNDFSAINSNSKFLELRVHSKAYLRHLIIAKEILGLNLASLHNLEFYYDLMSKIREKIENQTFDDWWGKVGTC